MNPFPTCIQTSSCSTSPLLASLSLLAFALSVLCHQSLDYLCATPLVQSPFVALASLSPPYGDLFACRHTATTLLICAHSPRPLVSIFLMIADLSGQSIWFPLCPHNSFGKPKSLFGFSLPHSPSLLVQSFVHSYSFGEPNTQLGFSLPQSTSLLCSIMALPETSQQSEAAPSANPVLCLDSPFHSLISLFGVLFVAAPLVNPILCLDSHFHRLLFG